MAQDGRTITINSPETRQALEFVVQLFREGMTPEVLSWDNSNNNQLLASRVGSWIHNPISAYRSIPDRSLLDNVFISPTPAGPKTRLARVPARCYLVWQWSREQAAAERFLFDFFSQYRTAMEASTGYNHPMLKAFETKPMPVIGTDPKLQVLQDFGQFAATDGYPGPSTAAAGQVSNTYVIPNMFAKACQGQPIDQVIAQAEEQIRSIYQRFPPA